MVDQAAPPREHPAPLLIRLLPLGMVITLVAFGLAALTLTRQRSESRDTQMRICQVSKDDRAVLRSLLRLAKHSRPETPESRAYYKQAFSLIPPISCEALQK